MIRSLREWTLDREQRRRAASYVVTLLLEPSEDDVRWLSEHGTDCDVDHARWELRYARRALGLLGAQRDALDDRTPSEALRALLHRMHKDRNVDGGLVELAERQFNARLSAYRDAFTSRTPGSSTTRVAQNLLAFSGGPIRADAPAVQRGAELVARYLAESNAALRRSFGEAQLPEHVAPSMAR